jgi:hypothetical protein
MQCRFLESLSLATLIAPISDETFRSLYWEHQPLIIHRKNPEYYGDLFTLQDFDEAILRSPDYLKLANAATNKNAAYKGAVTEGLEAALADMRAGGTLVLDQLHRHEPKLAQLCRVLASQTGQRFQTNLYLTPPNGRGFTPHWDNHDVFILQVVGSKHWKIEKQLRKYPSKDEPMGDEGRELRGDLHVFTLEQGDVVYIPRGFVHAAECGAEPSLHITLGIVGDHWDDLVYAAVRAAILQNEQLRHPLPLGFNRPPHDALIGRLKGVFRELADPVFLRGVVDQFLDEIVRRYPLDVSNQVTEFLAPRPLGLDDVVAARPGIVFRMHVAADSVRINYGGRSLVFPYFFREALEFSLHCPGFAIRDLPGDLQEQERIVFIERLLEEGLVIRRRDPQAAAQSNGG